MIDREEIKSLLQMVLENNKILNACPLHEFEPMHPDEHPSAYKKHKCRNCGGAVDSIQRHWYEAGLKHGKETHERH